MKIVKRCEKGGYCPQWATHVLVYIDKRSFQEIVDKPKYMCYHHCLYLHTAMSAGHQVMSRIYSVDEWTRRVEAWEQEKKQMLKERWEKFAFENS
jgi:hypothetical protein